MSLLLINVSGLGAQLAVAILSSVDPEGVVASVLKQDVSRFVLVPGVGK